MVGLSVIDVAAVDCSGEQLLKLQCVLLTLLYYSLFKDCQYGIEHYNL